MIFIDRERQIDGKAIHPGTEWSQLAADTTETAEDEQGDHVVLRSVYAHPRVRAALEELTHFKCAYCEIDITRFDWDVEHFRPKGRVKEHKEHPGYYWLAYKWKNLLPACKFCNQNRKEKSLFTDPKPGDTGGKLDQFPLKRENRRAMDHDGDVSREEPLLIDPSGESPEGHFGYRPDGQIFELNGSERGKKSIEVFRLDLRRLRKARARELPPLIELLKLKRALQAADNGSAAAEIDGILDTFAADDRLFAGMMRFFISDPDALGLGASA